MISISWTISSCTHAPLFIFLFPDTNCCTQSVQWLLIHSLPFSMWGWTQQAKIQRESWRHKQGRFLHFNHPTLSFHTHTDRICWNSLAGRWFMARCCQRIISSWGLFMMTLQVEWKVCGEDCGLRATQAEGREERKEDSKQNPKRPCKYNPIKKFRFCLDFSNFDFLYLTR